MLTGLCSQPSKQNIVERRCKIIGIKMMNITTLTTRLSKRRLFINRVAFPEATDPDGTVASRSSGNYD